MLYYKAQIKTSDDKIINVMFNPSEYSISRDIKYSEKSVIGKDSPLHQFISGGTQTLTLSLFFNTYNFNNLDDEQLLPVDGNEELDVSIRTKEITDLLSVESDEHRPPECTFIWSSLQFKGIITNVSQKFTMFLNDGTPVRATMQITFKNTLTKNVPLHSPDRTKYRIINEGMRLWEQAYREYDDASKWREIAKANNISNPLDIRSGESICIPPL